MATAEHETANGHEAAPRRFALADGRPPAPLTDPPAERRLVAAVRDFPTLLETLPLKPADLSDRTLRALYAAALRLRDRDVPIFPETVAAEAARMLDGDEDRLLLLLRGLPESPVEIAAGDAERLSELARRRRYRARLQAALEAIADDGTDPDDLIAGLAATAEPADRPAVRLLGSREFDEADFDVEYLVEHLIARGQPMVPGGPAKGCKTLISTAVVIHGATGTPVLGYEKFAVPRPFRSAFVSMESGGATIRANARSICHSLGCRLSDLDGMVWWQLDSLKISDPGTLTALRREIERKQLELLVVDPLYLAIDLDADDSKSVYQMGKRLTAVGTLIRDTGCVVALIHHGIKRPQDPYRPMKLNDLSGAGVTEWAGQWGLISRRGEYDEERPGHHELWYRAGGRDFPGSLLAIDIDEFSPFGERREWRVSVRPASEVAAEMIEASEAAKLSQRQASEAAEARHYVDRYAAKVVGWLRRHPGGGSASDIRNSCGMAPKAWRLVLGHLLESEQIVECRYRAGNGHEYPGFRAADGDPDSSGFDSDSPGQSGSDGARSTDTDSPSLEGNPSPRVRPRKRGRSHDSRANKQRGGES